jgi:hypothetical protein
MNRPCVRISASSRIQSRTQGRKPDIPQFSRFEDESCVRRPASGSGHKNPVGHWRPCHFWATAISACVRRKIRSDKLFSYLSVTCRVRPAYIYRCPAGHTAGTYKCRHQISLSSKEVY